MQDLAAALGGQGAPPDMGPGPGPADVQAPPPDVGAAAPPDLGAAPPEAPQGPTSSLDALDAAEEALHAFIQIDPDEADRAVAAQCLQSILKLKAKNQSDAQSGGMTSLARALQGGGGGPQPGA
jgi:hypothetical protein